MKQVVQNLRSGTIEIEDVPPPGLRAPGVLVATVCSVLSPGTERAAAELGRSTLLGKALRRPDQVRKVLDSVRREGVWPTVRKVQQRLDVTRAMGYSCAGIVLESRDSAQRPGARVACAGTDAATHAEINFVPRNLIATIPDEVSFEEAAFAALGGVAIHAMRLGEVQLGDEVAVIGMGLVGLLLAQVLRAAGCRVAGFDPRSDRLALAGRLGIERTAAAQGDALEDALGAWNLTHGFHRVFIAAAAKSSAPVELAVKAAADRARIIVVGDVRTDIPRTEAYLKELSVIYARSYGPGRYDPAYEEQGMDYPRAYVPWTLARNLEAFLDLLARKQISVTPLITHRLPIEDATRAYDIVTGGEPSLGVVLQYPVLEAKPPASISLRAPELRRPGTIGAGFIGAGSYAAGTLLPLLKSRADVRLLSVVTTRGLSARKVAEQFGIARCSTNPADVLNDPEIDLVFIASRHDSHASLAQAALQAGKAVFVEKPLCLEESQLDALEEVWRAHPLPLMVGHNRRFAPATLALKEFFAATPAGAPLSIRYHVQAGPLPPDHWLHDPLQGGRILGEACHFVDWCIEMAGAAPVKMFAAMQGIAPDENLHAIIEFPGGTTATLTYETSAHASLPKEIIQVSRAGCTAIVENFASVELRSATGRSTRKFQGKGQTEMIAALLAGMTSGTAPVPASSWFMSARATLKLLESASTGLTAFLTPQS
ncbi:MAG: Gfo/Idh/MocA family oxidoreductase [Acidipila sp.]|nr:Gfo/Idh/MocA family oxidoreductase [Acidipila sp.]